MYQTKYCFYCPASTKYDNVSSSHHEEVSTLRTITFSKFLGQKAKKMVRKDVSYEMF